MCEGNFDYLWFMEFQRNGTPHYHLLTSIPKPTDDDTERKLWQAYAKRIAPDCKQTQEHVLYVHLKRSDRQAWENLRSGDGAARYVTKYALKPHQKLVPDAYQDVGRFWGHNRDLMPEADECITFENREDVYSEDVWQGVLKAEGHRTSGWKYPARYLYDVKSVRKGDE